MAFSLKAKLQGLAMQLHGTYLLLELGHLDGTSLEVLSCLIHYLLLVIEVLEHLAQFQLLVEEGKERRGRAGGGSGGGRARGRKRGGGGGTIRHISTLCVCTMVKKAYSVCNISVELIPNPADFRYPVNNIKNHIIYRQFTVISRASL